ncbi:hypothetical protein ACFWA6_16290 [Streptomyces sp. NPDC060020]|uniref:hypothetical protein n=1 Tax=Streptomyces sp. NPDC060020 TaxID=3347038 RepID=UPI00369AF721
MATKSLAHGMGTFYKDCEHPQSRWSKCPHDYTLRYRNAAGKWKAGQRDLAESSLRTLESLLEHRILPTLGSRRMSTFDHKVVDGFIRTMERNGAPSWASSPRSTIQSER